MQNPISARVRGWLYVTGVALGLISASAGAVIAALNSGDQLALVASLLGAFTALTNGLARANLSPEED